MVKRYSRGRGKTRKKQMNSRKIMNSRKRMNSKKRRPKTRKRKTRRYKRTLMKGGAHNPHLKIGNKTYKVVKFMVVNGNNFYEYELKPMTYTSIKDVPDNSQINVMVDEKEIGEDFLYQAGKINIVFVEPGEKLDEQEQGEAEAKPVVKPMVFDPAVPNEVEEYEKCCATSVLSEQPMSGEKLTFVDAELKELSQTQTQTPVQSQRGGDGVVNVHPEGNKLYPDGVERRVGGTGREARLMDKKGVVQEVVDLDKTIYNTKGSTDKLTREQLLDLFKQENVTRTQSAPVRGSVEGNNTELESTRSAPAVVEGKTTEVSADVSSQTPSSSGDSGPKTYYKANKNFNTSMFENVKVGDIFECDETENCYGDTQKKYLRLKKDNKTGWVPIENVSAEEPI